MLKKSVLVLVVILGAGLTVKAPMARGDDDCDEIDLACDQSQILYDEAKCSDLHSRCTVSREQIDRENASREKVEEEQRQQQAVIDAAKAAAGTTTGGRLRASPPVPAYDTFPGQTRNGSGTASSSAPRDSAGPSQAAATNVSASGQFKTLPDVNRCLSVDNNDRSFDARHPSIVLRNQCNQKIYYYQVSDRADGVIACADTGGFKPGQSFRVGYTDYVQQHCGQLYFAVCPQVGTDTYMPKTTSGTPWRNPHDQFTCALPVND